KAAIERPVRAAGLLELAGGEPHLIQGPHVTTAALAGDELGVELLRELGSWIGQGCASLAAILDPEMFVVGGGVIAAGELLLESARDAYEEHLPALGHRPVA